MNPANATAKPPRVLFVADSGPEVGGGHLMRCLSLAGALGDLGASCAFVEAPEASGVLRAFADKRIERLPVRQGLSAAFVQEAASLAGRWAADLVVVDHYGMSAEQESGFACPGRAIAVIDDLAEREHACGLLIDPSLGRRPEDYRALIPPGARVLAGPAYALLRPEYAKARPEALTRRGAKVPASTLLIALGLTDVGGITGRVLNIVRPALGEIEVDVVVGAGTPSLTWLQRLAEADPRIRLHVQTQEMARLMVRADIAIGAGGSSTWERACLGLPSISLVLADNQRPLAHALEGRGAALAVEAAGEGLPDRLLAAFERLRSDGRLRAGLSEASSALCDGLGAGRCAEALLELVG